MPDQLSQRLAALEHHDACKPDVAAIRRLLERIEAKLLQAGGTAVLDRAA